MFTLPPTFSFNAGHSAAMLLSTFPSVVVTSFDACIHRYTLAAVGRLHSIFGESRHSLTCAMSGVGVPHYLETLVPSSPGTYSAALVDGGHLYDVAFADIVNSARALRPGGVLVVDDCSLSLEDATARLWATSGYEFHVSLAFKHAVAMGIVTTLQGDVCGDCGLCVGVVDRTIEAEEARELLAFVPDEKVPAAFEDHEGEHEDL